MFLCFYGPSILFVLGLVFVFRVYSVRCCLVVSTSAIDCLESKSRLQNDLSCVEWDVNPTHSLTHPVSTSLNVTADLVLVLVC